jgi:hypothetical protein
MMDFLKNAFQSDVIAGVANVLIVLVPAIATFFLGMKKYSNKAKLYMGLVKECIDLLDAISDSLQESSESGKKISNKEMSRIMKEIKEIECKWEQIRHKEVANEECSN